MNEDAGFDADAPGEKPTGEKPTGEQPAGVKPDRALTLRPRALAGNPTCLNCGTPLQGPYCHYCGQPDRNFLRFFPALMRDLLEDFLDLDSRFMRTMKPLLFKPGRLTRDFLEGRRFRYTPPMRLYLFSSLIFFLMAATLSTDAIDIQMQNRGGGDTGMVIGWNDEEVSAGTTSEKTLEDLDPATRTQVEAAVERAEQARVEAAQAQAEGDRAPTGDAEPRPGADGETPAPPSAPGPSIDWGQEQWDDETEGFTDMTVGGKPWDYETNPVDIPFLPRSVNTWINDEIAESPNKAKEISKNPNLIIENVFDVAPVAMFLLLPVAALLYKFWYLFARRYYIEHLIFALHNHAFIFVALIIVLLLGLAEDASREASVDWLTATLNGIETALWIWLPVYFYFAMKHVYRQGWVLTFFKYAAVGLSYSVLLVFLATTLALVSFVLI